MISLASIDRAAHEAAHHTGQFVTTHARGITAAAVVAMVGFAATAFGIAPLAPDAAALPQRLVQEAIQGEDISPQLEALAAHELSLYRNEQLRSGDTADSLLKRLNIVDAEAAAFLRSNAVARGLFTGRSGKMVQARSNASGQLVELVARYAPDDSALLGSHFSRLQLERQAGGFHARIATVPLQTQMRLGSGTIRQSLFAAADEARLPDVVAIQIAEIFSADIDFHRELRRGDTFTVVYEALTADGEAINWNQGAGRVLAAEFVNKGQVHTALWFEDPTAGQAGTAKGAYFDMNGQNKRRSFLSSPLEFSRVTSGFAMRLHPIMRTWRQHNGIDYGAPSGTPVRTVGDGTVEFAGRQGGYGNVVKVRHSNDRTTVYAHLSRIDVRQGARVEQGQSIGAVGATGWATGPHLHFEFIVKGDHVNPMVVAQSSEVNVVSAGARAAFRHWAQGVRSQLDVAQSVAQRADYAE